MSKAFSFFIFVIYTAFSFAIPTRDSNSEPSPTCPDQNGQFSHPEYCDQYINCWEGVGIVEKCQLGLLFNPTNSTCDFPNNVICEGKPDSRPQADPGKCPEAYGTFNNPEHCGQFIICQGGDPIIFKCPKGLVYNSSLGVCVYREEDDTCLDGHLEEDEYTPTTDISISQDSELSEIPVSSSRNSKGSVLFPVVSGWPSSYSKVLKCPAGEVIGFVNEETTFAVCIKKSELKI